MSSQSTAELLEELKNFDTPSVTNVVATYPDSKLCLGLYNPWTENWYTDQTIRCMYPELGRLVGYAVTCVYGLPDPNFNRLSFIDVVEALEASPKPTVLVLQQKFPPEIAGKVGLAGGNMVSAMKAMGCVGLISNGPSRDLDEVRPMKFQYMLTGVTAGHGAMAVHAVNVPVSVGGMDVTPGEIIHMDENGAVKFPANKLEEVVKLCRELQKEEIARQSALQKARTAAEIRAILSGHSYSKEEK
jgi:4-hydroxy-4-methyl-2-oxoglutarate aldolase